MSSITFKVILEQNANLVRKISVENAGLSYDVLRQRIGALAPPPPDDDGGGGFLVQYDDEDGDRITVGGDDELKQMLIDMVRLHACSVSKLRSFHLDFHLDVCMYV